MKKKSIYVSLFILLIAIFGGCGGGGGGDSVSDEPVASPVESAEITLTGYFTSVEGVDYETTSGLAGRTGADGSFSYRDGDEVTFYAGGARLGRIEAKESVSLFSFSKPELVSQVLAALDNDGDLSNGIVVDAVEGRTLSGMLQRRDVSYSVDIEQLSAYDPKYREFLQQNGLYIQPGSEAFAAQAIAQLKLPVTKPTESYIYRAMGGDYKIPVDRFANDPIVQDRMSSEKYNYRLTLAAVHQMYLEMVQAQKEVADKVIEDAQTLDEEVEAITQSVTYAVNTALNTDTYLKADDGLKEYLISQSADAYGLVTGFTIPDDFSTTAKLSGTVLFGCAPNLDKPEELGGCAIDLVQAGVGEAIVETIGDSSPILAGTLKDLTALAADLGKVALSCKESLVSPDCIKDATNALLGQSLKLTGETLKIYKLGKNVEYANSKAIALEIFLAGKYRDVKSLRISYCELAEYYGGSRSECEDLNDSFFDGSAYRRQLDYLVKKVIESNKVAELTSGVLGLTTEYDVDQVQTSIDELVERFVVVRNKLNNKLEDRYCDLDGTVRTDAVQDRIETEVVLSEPTISTDYNEDGTANIRSCFSYYSKRALEGIEADLSIYDDRNGKTSMQMESYASGSKGAGTICGVVENYSPVAGDDEFAPFVIEASLEFRFGNTSFEKSFEVSRSALYEYRVEQEPQRGEPAVDFTASYDPDRSVYSFGATVTDPLFEDGERYSYLWRIQNDRSCYIDLEGSGAGMEFSLPDECKEGVLQATLSVYTDKGRFVARKTRRLDPVSAAEDLFAVAAEPAILSLDPGSTGRVELVVKGGTGPFNIAVDGVGSPFRYTVETETRIRFESTAASDDPVENDVTITLTDANGEKAEVVIKLRQPGTPTQVPSLAWYSSAKLPYSTIDRPARIELGSDFVQKWGLQNSSSVTLRNVVMRPNPVLCSSTLSHSRDPIVLGDLAPGDYVEPSVSISTAESFEGSDNYCQWEIFHTDADGVERQLIWSKSRQPARVNYRIIMERKSDPYPPIIKNLSIAYTKDGNIEGSFEIVQPSSEVTHLRILLSSRSDFGDGSTIAADIGGDYESIQPTGIKSFSVPVDTWPTKLLYWRLEASNIDGVEMQERVEGKLYLVDYTPPIVTGVTPTMALIDTPTIFTVTGSDFPSSLALSLQDGECGTPVVEEDRAFVECTPKASGQKRFYVAIRSGGDGVYGQDDLYVGIVDRIEDLIRLDGTLRMEPEGDGLKISWSAASGSGVRYELYRSFSAGEIGEKIFIGSDLSYIDDDLSDGTTYYYTLKACNAYGCVQGAQQAYTFLSAASSDAPVVILKSAPAVATDESDVQIVVEISDPNADAQGIAILWGDGNSSTVDIGGSTGTVTVTLSHRYAEAGFYVWQLQAIDAAENKSDILKGSVVVSDADIPSTSDDVRNLLADSVWYGVEIKPEGYRTLTEYRFDSQMSRLDWRDIEGGDGVGSQTLELIGNVVKVIDETEEHYFRVVGVASDYIEIESVDLAGTVIVPSGETMRLYRLLEDAQAEYGAYEDLGATLTGTTLYLRECGSVVRYLFGSDGVLTRFDENGTKLSEQKYRIDKDVVYTDEDGTEIPHLLQSLTTESIRFLETDGTTTTFYFTESGALLASTDVCDGGSDVGTIIDDLVSGTVTFYDENNATTAVPSDAWVRITPSRFQTDGAWYGVNCRVAPDGRFGAECYIDIDADLMREVFADPAERFQIVVYKNHIDPDGHHWECGEDVYRYLFDSQNNTDQFPYGSWSSIDVYPQDYQDRSTETCDGSDTTAVTVTVEPTGVVTGLTASYGLYPDRIDLGWNLVDGADGYEVYRCISTSTGSCELLAQTVTTSYSDTTAMAQSTYYYRIRARFGDTLGDFSDYAVGRLSDDALLPVVAGVVASKGEFVDKIVVSWDAIELSDGANYELYRCSDTTVDSCILLSRRTTNSFEDEKESGLMVGEVYYYRVRVQGVGDESGDFSSYDSGYLADSPTVQTPSATQGIYGDRVRVSWPDEPSASQYEIYACNTYAVWSYEVETSTECRSLGVQSAVDDQGNRYTMIDDYVAEPGKKYWYFVRARIGDSWGEFSEKSNSGYRGLDQPLVPDVSVTVIDDIDPTLAILPTPPGEHGAMSYKVYRCSDAVDTGSCQLLQEVLPYISVYDNRIERQVDYYYRAKSVSYSGNESDFSVAVVGRVP